MIRKFITALPFFVVLSAIATAQPESSGENSHALPADWSNLPASDFVEAASQALNAQEIDEATLSDVREHAKDLLQDDANSSNQNAGLLLGLFNLAKPALSAEELQELKKRLVQGNVPSEQIDFANLQLQVEVMEAGSDSTAEARAMISIWCDAHPTILTEAERTDEWSEDIFRNRLGWLLWRLRPETVCGRDFTATWTGTIRAPRDGNYILSICPVNSSYENETDRQFLRQAMRVKIDGEQIVDARWDKWQSESGPIALLAGQPVNIEVEYTYVRMHPDEPEKGTVPTNGMTNPVALLYWEGPGIEKSLVPTSALAPPDGTGHGLLATYRSTKDGPVTTSRIEDRIDHNWVSGYAIVPLEIKQQKQLVDEAMKRFRETSFTKDWLESRPRWLIHDLQWILECLPLEQRLHVIGWALLHPEVMKLRPWWSIEQFYANLRHDAPEDALDVFGQWMVDHADLAPELSDDFFAANRMSCLYLADAIFHQHPPSAQQLETSYLTKEDGTCVLPSAYILAYGYLSQGRISDWIAKLDQQLEDNSMSGERRVNWLLARAMAEEIRRQRTGRNVFSRPRLWDGIAWIDEAALIAENAETKDRVQKERLARLVGAGQWEAADIELRGASESLAAWSETISELKSKAAADTSEQAQKSQATYVAEIRRRQEMAKTLGDSAAAERYEQIINTQISEQ